MSVLVLVRHGESEWNSRRLFTGWSDPPLTARGRHQARQAGTTLATRRTAIDQVYTSALSRATETASIMIAPAGGPAGGPVAMGADWRLNERHLGRLEGLTKAEVTATWGNEWRKRWRDDDVSRPPPVDLRDPRHPRHDSRYRHVPAHRLPGAERGCDTAERVLDFWSERLHPDLLAGRNVMVVSHLGPLRILARHLGCGTPGAPAVDRWRHAETLLFTVQGDATGGAGASLRQPSALMNRNVDSRSRNGEKVVS